MRVLLASLALLLTAGSSAAAAAAGPRVCPSSIRPAARHFNLRATEYDLELPDGRTVRQMAYNGTAVGPTLVVNLGEEVSVDIANAMSVPTSTHWHGLYLRNRAWSDGVDGVTQAAYKPGSTFRYKFRAEPAGTYWYHAHTGTQFANGLRGPLIIKDPKDPYAGAYHEERVLMMYDQADKPSDEELEALQTGKATMLAGLCEGVAPPRDYSDTPFYSLFTNGQGWVKDPKGGKPLGGPHVITVQRGKTYRFRTIQGAASWGIVVEPTKHAIDIIAVDGAEVARTRAAAYTFTPGERVDFLLKADKPVGNYWIHVATLTGANSPAVLHYEGAPDPLRDEKLGAPPLDLGCTNQLRPEILDLSTRTLRPQASLPQPPPLSGRPTLSKVVFLSNNADPSQALADTVSKRAAPGLLRNLPRNVRPRAGCPKLADGSESKYCWSLNWVVYEKSQRPLLSTPANASLSSSTYVMDVPLGAVVDVAFINPTGMLHPMHIHGHSHWVLGTGRGNILTPDGQIDYSKLQRAGPYMVRDNPPVPPAQPRNWRRTAVRPAGAGAGMAAPPAKPMPQPSGGMDGMGGMGAGRRLAQTMGGMGSGMPAPRSSAPTAKPMAGGMLASPTAKPMDGGMASTPVTPDEYGYTVVRLVANNPSTWAWHCHIDVHAASGMFFALRVGNKWDVPAGLDACAA